MGSQEVLGRDTESTILPNKTVSFGQAARFLEKNKMELEKLIKKGEIKHYRNSRGRFIIDEKSMIDLKNKWESRADNSVKARFDRMVERVDELETKVQYLMYTNNVEESEISIRDLVWYYDEACDIKESRDQNQTYDYVVRWLGFLNRLTLDDMYRIVITCHDNNPTFPFIYIVYVLRTYLTNMRRKNRISRKVYDKTMEDTKSTHRYLKILQNKCSASLKTRIEINKYSGGSKDILDKKLKSITKKPYHKKLSPAKPKAKDKIALLFEKIPQKTTDS